MPMEGLSENDRKHISDHFVPTVDHFVLKQLLEWCKSHINKWSNIGFVVISSCRRISRRSLGLYFVQCSASDLDYRRASDLCRRGTCE